MGIERFHKVLSDHHPDGTLSGPDAAEALRNLTGFLETLIRINERAKLVPNEPPMCGRHRGGRDAGE